MKLVGQTPGRSARSAASIKFPGYIWLGLCLLAAMTMMVSGSVMAGYHEVFDPMTAISELFEGDAGQVARGFTCERTDWNSPPYTGLDYCTQRNPNPMYTAIHLRISGSVAKDVSLSLRENMLTLGVLVALWGKPETHRYCETLLFTWSARRFTAMVAVPRTSHIDYFVPIHHIYFVRRGLPEWARLLVNDALHSC
jgi:hypothetical protein